MFILVGLGVCMLVFIYGCIFIWVDWKWLSGMEYVYVMMMWISVGGCLCWSDIGFVCILVIGEICMWGKYLSDFGDLRSED